MLCLEVWRERRVEEKEGKESIGEERRGEGRGMVIPSPCLDVLKNK